MSNKPLYQLILDNLINDIHIGKYQAGDQLPTELELSTKYNVSRITSKRALTELEALGHISRTQGKGSFVKKVRVNNESNQLVKNILLIYPFSTGENAGLGDYTQGILEEIQAKGFQLTVQTENFLIETSKEELLSQYIGIIYYPQRTIEGLDNLYHLFLNDIPIIIIDKFFHGLPFSTVSSDNLTGGELATTHLLEQNHVKIAFSSLEGEIEISSVRDRYLGYLNALHNAGIRENYHFMQQKDQSKEAYFKAVVKMIQQEEVSAILFENDVLGIQFMNYLHQQKNELIDKLAFVGFDNIQASSLIQPSLTTIEQDFLDTGRKACRMILEQLEVGNRESKNETTKVKLIIRNSSRIKNIRK